jgi:hypothetical protein
MAAVCGLATLVLLVVAALHLLQKGPRRPALVAPLVPLVGVPMLLAVSLGSFRLINAFASLSLGGTGGSALVLAAGRDIWSLTRIAGGGVAALGAVGLAMGLIRGGGEDRSAACSPSRALALLVLPAAALVLLAGLVREERTALHIARLVVEDKSAANDAAFAAYGFGEGSGAIAAVSSRIARATVLGSVGGIVAAVILLGLALTGGLLAWPARVGRVFTAASIAIWIAVVAAGAALAAGLYSPV